LRRDNERLRQQLTERAAENAEQKKQIADAERQIADLERQLALRKRNSTSCQRTGHDGPRTPRAYSPSHRPAGASSATYWATLPTPSAAIAERFPSLLCS
jgi:hypothetical protein